VKDDYFNDNDLHSIFNLKPWGAALEKALLDYSIDQKQPLF
jgi:hypothetical protein